MPRKKKVTPAEPDDRREFDREATGPTMVRNIGKTSIWLGKGARLEPGEVCECDEQIAGMLALQSMVEIL